MDKLGNVAIVMPKGGVIPSSVIGAHQLLRAAGGDRLSIEIVGEKEEKLMEGLVGLRPTRGLSDDAIYQLIIVSAIPDVSVRTMENNRELMEWLIRQHANGARIASLCTGTFILAETGLLDGRCCTTHWAFSEEFLRRYPRTRFRRNGILTEDGPVFTNGGAYSFLNLVVYLIERYYGKEIAGNVSNFFQVDYPRESQDRFVVFAGQKRHADETVLRAQEFIESNFVDRLGNEEIARAVNLGTRTLVRRFKAAIGDTPNAYLQRVRVEAAKEKLQSTDEPIGTIQFAVGYNDPKTFRSIFQRFTGLTPSQFRKNYRRRA